MKRLLRYCLMFAIMAVTADVAAQGITYYICCTHGSVSRKSADSNVWTTCPLALNLPVGLSDSVMVDTEGSMVLTKENGGVRAVVTTDFKGRAMVENLLDEAERRSGNALAANNSRISDGGTHRDEVITMRGTLTDISQIEALVKMVRTSIETKPNDTDTSIVRARIVASDTAGDYISVTNSSDSVYYINVLVCNSDGTLRSLYEQISEETTTLGNRTFAYIALPAHGTLNLDMFRFFGLENLSLYMFATIDQHNIVLFNSLLNEDIETTNLHRISENITISRIIN